MILQNSIGWCDDTTNAVTGCDKISPGCKGCYAATGTRARVLRAQGIETWGVNGTRHPVAEYATKLRRLNQLCVCDRCHHTAPIARLGEECGWGESGILADDECRGTLRRIRLFADSNSDWLDAKWELETLARFLRAIGNAPNVDVQLLTKRPENFQPRVFHAAEWLARDTDAATAAWLMRWIEGQAPENLWIGASVEDKERLSRIVDLHVIPSTVRFLSCEPLLESLVLPHLGNIDWVIVGGESGKSLSERQKEQRDCGVDAIISIAEQCQSAGVPIYVKQDCAFHSGQRGRIPESIWNLKQFPLARQNS